MNARTARVHWHEVWASVLVVLIVDLLAGRKPKQGEQWANNGIIHDRRLIAASLRSRTLKVREKIDAAKLALSEKRKETLQKVIECRHE